jgi:hypothetical protein
LHPRREEKTNEEKCQQKDLFVPRKLRFFSPEQSDLDPEISPKTMGLRQHLFLSESEESTIFKNYFSSPQ